MDDDCAIRKQAELVELKDFALCLVVSAFCGVDEKRCVAWRGIETLFDVRLERERVSPTVTAHDADREVLVEGWFVGVMMRDGGDACEQVPKAAPDQA